MNKKLDKSNTKSNTRQKDNIDQLREGLDNLPMPSSNWEDNLYAKAIKNFSSKEYSANKHSGSKYKKEYQTAPVYLTWLNDSMLGKALNSNYMSVTVSAGLLALVVFLQPLNSLYGQLALTSEEQSIAYLEELVAFDPVLDAILEITTDAASGLSENYLLDDSWLINE